MNFISRPQPAESFGLNTKLFTIYCFPQSYPFYEYKKGTLNKHMSVKLTENHTGSDDISLTLVLNITHC